MSMYATVDLSDSDHRDLPVVWAPSSEGLVYGQNVGQCHAWDELDRIAEDAGARPLTAYFYSAEDESGDENWSPLADGVKTFKAILGDLEARSKDDAFGRYTVESIVWDVRAFASILEGAPAAAANFRLDVC